MRTIYVEGSIIFKEGLSWVKNIGTNCDADWRERADKVIAGDLNVTKDNQTKSYVEYLAGGEVVILGSNEVDCRFLNSPEIAINEYRSNIELVKEFAKVDLPDRFDKIRFNQLFISAVANLELFLSEMMVNMVLGYEEFYKKFLVKHGEKIRNKEQKQFDHEPQQFIYRFIKQINCHQLKKIQSFFEEVLDIDLPNQNGLNDKIMWRHDLVHRFGKEKEGREKIVTEQDLEELIYLTNSFVDVILKELSSSISNWSVISND